VVEPFEAVEQPEIARGRRPLFRAFQVGALLFVAGLLALLIWRVATEGRGKQLVKEIKADKKPPAPKFNLPVLWPHRETWPASLAGALADNRISPAELKGHPLVLNFFASWCIPCRHEAPLLDASAHEHAGRVVFLGVDVQDLKSDARGFLKRYHVNYVAVHDGGGSTYDGYGLTGVPETYWIDARGRIVAHYPGAISRRLLEQGIREAAQSK
jgi:cytochrome c biogenesis protein CcmG/thiol:disulfide interchange protein DsbE